MMRCRSKKFIYSTGRIKSRCCGQVHCLSVSQKKEETSWFHKMPENSSMGEAIDCNCEQRENDEEEVKMILDDLSPT